MYMSHSPFRAGKGHGIGRRPHRGVELDQEDERSKIWPTRRRSRRRFRTFYRRASPDDDPYVDEGDRVSDGQVIGLVEVMKNFNEVADRDGVLESFLVENEDLVEAGQDIAALAAE